jgi:hypothetical protein
MRLTLDIPDINAPRVARAYGRLLRLGNDAEGNRIVATEADLMGYIMSKISETVGWSEGLDLEEEAKAAAAAVEGMPDLGLVPGGE